MLPSSSTSSQCLADESPVLLRNIALAEGQIDDGLVLTAIDEQPESVRRDGRQLNARSALARFCGFHPSPEIREGGPGALILQYEFCVFTLQT